jgi:hypothetical protein
MIDLAYGKFSIRRIKFRTYCYTLIRVIIATNRFNKFFLVLTFAYKCPITVLSSTTSHWVPLENSYLLVKQQH